MQAIIANRIVPFNGLFLSTFRNKMAILNRPVKIEWLHRQ